MSNVPSSSPWESLLHYAPLLSTTGTLMFTLCEDLYLRPFTQLSPPARALLDELLPHYIGRWFPSGFRVILTLYPLTWITTVVKLSRKGGLQSTSAKWQAAGLFFSLAHMWWGRRAKGLLDRIRRGYAAPDYDDTVAILAVWLRLNVRRGFLVDLPAWLSFLFAEICR